MEGWAERQGVMWKARVGRRAMQGVEPAVILESGQSEVAAKRCVFLDFIPYCLFIVYCLLFIVYCLLLIVDC